MHAGTYLPTDYETAFNDDPMRVSNGDAEDAADGVGVLHQVCRDVGLHNGASAGNRHL